MNIFPKHPGILRDNSNPLFREWEQKQIGFAPLTFCEFFQGMDVLESRGISSGEQIFGLYWNDEYCGHCYFGEKYTQKRAAELAEIILPKRMKDVQKFVKENIGVVQYKRFHESQYAFVTEKVLTKIEKPTKKEKYL